MSLLVTMSLSLTMFHSLAVPLAQTVDFLPTKGIEYLLVIGYLLLLIPFFWWSVGLSRRPRPVPARIPVGPGGSSGGRRTTPFGGGAWFRIPDGLHFHRGHTWVEPEGGGVFRVGMDDFAHRLLGAPEGMELPEVGDRLEQGEAGWRLRVGGREVPLLAPVSGRVLEVHPQPAPGGGGNGSGPASAERDPYGDGWLLRVQADREEGTLRNLMPGSLARAWTQEAADRLSTEVLPELGRVLQDGGEPVPGFLRQLAPEDWPAIAGELLLLERRPRESE